MTFFDPFQLQNHATNKERGSISENIFFMLFMNWTVYILRCADDSLYTGITTDLERRVAEHNKDNKKGAKYTRVRRPVKPVHQEKCENRAQASRREYELKKLSRAKKIQLIENGNSL